MKKRTYEIFIDSGKGKCCVIVSVKPYVKIKRIIRKIPNLDFPEMVWFEVPMDFDLEGAVEFKNESINAHVIFAITQISNHIMELCEKNDLAIPDGFEIKVQYIGMTRPMDVSEMARWVYKAK